MRGEVEVAANRYNPKELLKMIRQLVRGAEARAPTEEQSCQEEGQEGPEEVRWRASMWGGSSYQSVQPQGAVQDDQTASAGEKPKHEQSS